MLRWKKYIALFVVGIENYFLEEIKQNKLMSRNHKKICTTLNYIEHFLVLDSAVTGCISIYAFAFLIGIPCELQVLQ